MSALRVAVLEFMTESNTFTIERTRMDEFHASHYLFGSELIEVMRDTGSEVGGCIGFAEENGWELVPIIAAHAQPGGIVTEEARKQITVEAVARLKTAGPLDGVFIALHGAMVTETAQDGESQFLQAVRNVVGDRMPIAATFDLHGNIFDETANLLDIAVTYRTYPHIDMHERGGEAAGLLHRAMNGEIQPKLLIRRPPMLMGCDDGRTTNDGPMCRLLEMAQEETGREGILNVAINAGFTDADVYAAGPTVVVTYDGGTASNRKAAEESTLRICDAMWSYRDDWDKPAGLSDCIERLKQERTDPRPLVIADFADNPGSGAYCDATTLLKTLLDLNVGNAGFGALFDPEAAALLTASGTGARRRLLVGGKTDPKVGGGPLMLEGEVMAVSDGSFVYEGPMFTGLPGNLGPSVCFRVDGVDILIASERVQMFDKNIFRAVGIEPVSKSVLVVKSMQHFRGAFAPIASQIMVVDAGGLCSPDLGSRDYRNVRRPVFPLDDFDD